MDNLIPVLVGLPLAGATVLLLGGRRLDRFGHWLGVLASTASFVVGLVLFFSMLGRSTADRPIHDHLYTWVSAGTRRTAAGPVSRRRSKTESSTVSALT